MIPEQITKAKIKAVSIIIVGEKDALEIEWSVKTGPETYEDAVGTYYLTEAAAPYTVEKLTNWLGFSGDFTRLDEIICKVCPVTVKHEVYKDRPQVRIEIGTGARRVEGSEFFAAAERLNRLTGKRATQPPAPANPKPEINDDGQPF